MIETREHEILGQLRAVFTPPVVQVYEGVARGLDVHEIKDRMRVSKEEVNRRKFQSSTNIMKLFEWHGFKHLLSRDLIGISLGTGLGLGVVCIDDISDSKKIVLLDAQKKTLKYLCHAYTDEQIGKKMNMKPRAIENYYAELFALIGARNRYHAMAIAQRNPAGFLPQT